MPALTELEIADEPAVWSAAGFRVENGVCAVSRVAIRLAGKGPRRGIVGWMLADEEPDAPAAPPQPNGAVAIDHVVMLTPELDATVEELRADGFDLRRIREGETPGGSTRQAFFRVGEPVLEVVQAPERIRLGGARLWGLAFVVRDMDATATALGDRLGTPRAAVQPGREIATLRPEAELGPAIAFMTPGRGAI